MAQENDRIIASNRLARRNYELFDTWEAGLVLQGSEVKSLREAKVQISEAFGRAEGGQLWLVGLHISPYRNSGNEAFGHDPDRQKKLLLHRREISRITDRLDRDGLTLVPLSLYFKNGRAKIEVALARGRATYDKRHALAKRDAEREAQRAMGRQKRGL
ncbi:MAG: SsrA-binding protein SmpB [Actinobacteria bacterium]|jgi:SsrA-binding protein|nr:SsrA-binding protein SmpB [Actinomycetota bacterium]MBT4303422.1 SsrA-binding protein SmpB [Actinomycetota bacterium]MBT5117471.1 SsrA-binding protein SmpB [Actinomycetota bacterium]